MMKTEFKFSNLLGTVYSRGNLIFTPDGTCLISPVGNRVTVFDLVRHTSYTLPLAHRRNISRLALDSSGKLLITVDEDGRAIITNFPRRIILYHFGFKSPITALSFSPNGKYLAVGVGRFIRLWHMSFSIDGEEAGLDFSPLTRYHVHAGHHDIINQITWSGDGRFFVSSSKDQTARLWSLQSTESFQPTLLAGHRQEVRAAWFSKDQETVYTISKDGALFVWRVQILDDVSSSPDLVSNGNARDRWHIIEKHFFNQNNASVRCAAFHAASNLLVVGFSNGLFAIYELPDFNAIYSLSISQNDIDFVEINDTGEWLAFGASKLGQLLVWEWQSESYILKQQGHFDSLSALTYSPDGQRIITCADDGKIKVWDVESGFCIVTFTEHTSAITACEFGKRGNVLFTSSLDGSVRAWDMIRYRNFRTFTAPIRLSYASVAVDPSGEVVCAGSQDSFSINIWSVQTGQLLDELGGHEGPVTSLAFAPTGGALVSGSWDHTVRIWDIFSRTQSSEPITLQSECLSVAFRPDSKQIAVSCLDGSLTFWSVTEATQQAGFDARRDISGGRKISDRRTATNIAGTKQFNAVAYSADGACVLASGNSKFICLYDVRSGALLKKFTVSINLSLDGTQEILNSRNMTEAGPTGLIDMQGEGSDLEDRIDSTLPGTNRKADASLRKTQPDVRVPAIAFSPTGRAFCAATTEGLLIYSLDRQHHFDPVNLDVEITPFAVMEAINAGSSVKAIIMSFRLNDRGLLHRAYEKIPPENIQSVIKHLPTLYLEQLSRFVALSIEQSPHLEFNLLWVEEIIKEHGAYMKAHAGKFAVELRVLQRAVKKIHSDMGRLADDNGFALDFVLGQCSKY